jgi:HEAT repeat protein
MQWAHQQLKSKKPETRRQAVAKLALEGSQQAIQLLCLALGDSDRDVRLMALRALSPLRVTAAANAFVGALRDSEPDVREAAVLALMQLGDLSVVPALTGALKDSHPGVRQRAAKALDMFGWTPGGETEFVQRSVAIGDFTQAARCGDAALAPLLAALQDQRSPHRRRVVEALARMDDKRVVKPLVAALKDQDAYLRVAVLEALAHVCDKETSEPILSVLKDKDPVVRATAAATLSKLGEVRAVDALLPLLKDSNWSVRKGVAEALGRFGKPQAVEPLVKLLTDPDHEVREAVVGALGQIANRRAIEFLVGTLADPQSSVRHAVTGALQKIDPHWLGSAEAQRAIPRLTEALSSKDHWVRHCALDTLKKLTEPGGRESTAGFLTEMIDPRKTTTLQALLNTLGDWDRDLRFAAAEALGRMADPKAQEALTAAQKDSDAWVAKAVTEALSRLTLSSVHDLNTLKRAETVFLGPSARRVSS